jgi:hypothetical protein
VASTARLFPLRNDRNDVAVQLVAQPVMIFFADSLTVPKLVKPLQLSLQLAHLSKLVLAQLRSAADVVRSAMAKDND